MTNDVLQQPRPPGRRLRRKSRVLTIAVRMCARRWCIGSIALLAMIGVTPAVAQLGEREDRRPSGEVRGTAERVLSSPEFRNLQRKIQQGGDDLGPDVSMGPGGDGGGNGGEGDGNAPGNGNPPQGNRNDGGGDEPAGERNSSMRVPQGAGLGAVGAIFHGLAWLLLAAVCGFIVFLIVKAIAGYEGRPKETALGGDADVLQGDAEPEHPPGELPADVYLARARELALAGQFREAIAQLLLGAMSAVERAGLVRYRRGLTYRDYVRATRPQPGLHQAMRAIVQVYEPLGFGRREAARRHFDTTLESYEKGFRGTHQAVED